MGQRLSPYAALPITLAPGSSPGSTTCGILDIPYALSTFIGPLPGSHAVRPGNASVVKTATACQAFRLPQHGAG